MSRHKQSPASLEPGLDDEAEQPWHDRHPRLATALLLALLLALQVLGAYLDSP